MRIDITQDDIDNGKRHDCKACPIALACIKAGFKGVSVGTSLSYNNGPLVRYSANLPREAINFTIDFDEGIKVKPFSFDIED